MFTAKVICFCIVMLSIVGLVVYSLMKLYDKIRAKAETGKGMFVKPKANYTYPVFYENTLVKFINTTVGMGIDASTGKVTGGTRILDPFIQFFGLWFLGWNWKAARLGTGVPIIRTVTRTIEELETADEDSILFSFGIQSQTVDASVVMKNEDGVTHLMENEVPADQRMLDMVVSKLTPFFRKNKAEDIMKMTDTDFISVIGGYKMDTPKDIQERCGSIILSFWIIRNAEPKRIADARQAIKEAKLAAEKQEVDNTKNIAKSAADKIITINAGEADAAVLAAANKADVATEEAQINALINAFKLANPGKPIDQKLITSTYKAMIEARGLENFGRTIAGKDGLKVPVVFGGNSMPMMNMGSSFPTSGEGGYRNQNSGKRQTGSKKQAAATEPGSAEKEGDGNE